jgi:hypothetical protein
MRYRDGGGLTAEQWARREKVRLGAAGVGGGRPGGAGVQGTPGRGASWPWCSWVSWMRCRPLARIAQVVWQRFRVEYTTAGRDVLVHRLGWVMICGDETAVCRLCPTVKARERCSRIKISSTPRDTMFPVQCEYWPGVRSVLLCGLAEGRRSGA